MSRRTRTKTPAVLEGPPVPVQEEPPKAEVDAGADGTRDVDVDVEVDVAADVDVDVDVDVEAEAEVAAAVPAPRRRGRGGRTKPRNAWMDHVKATFAQLQQEQAGTDGPKPTYGMAMKRAKLTYVRASSDE